MSKALNILLEEYGESHQNSTNKLIHWICVPLIFYSIIALVYSIPNEILIPIFGDSIWANWATITLVIVLIYYAKLSIPIAIGMLLFSAVCMFVCQYLSSTVDVSLWIIALVIFVAAWAGQFYGHKVEGKKPSFLKDLQFLLIGPAWLMHFLFEKWGIKY
jgi:uncharacterized membrane protein YGL010W|tara:strand:+ start:107 stop:586 length:480 start_codon:yes stop_codon:yes gene_type:complete